MIGATKRRMQKVRTRMEVMKSCRTVELTRRREFNQASPDESSYETRSRRSRPTICSMPRWNESLALVMNLRFNSSSPTKCAYEAESRAAQTTENVTTEETKTPE